MTRTRQKHLTRIDPATDHVLGRPGAEVSIVEYADFASLACAEAHFGLQILRKEFGDETNLVFRHFPERAIHPIAEMAAEAAEAMGAQGLFWAYHDLLFARRAELSEAVLRSDAAELGADLIGFEAALLEHAYLQRVQEQMESARNLGIRAMPTFYVNGTLVDVSFGLEKLAEAVESALREVDGGSASAVKSAR